jgi:hypothetical protein
MVRPSLARSGLRALAAAQPVLKCWLLVGAVITLPYIVAATLPPPGRTFVGTFHWVDDFYNYVSFVQQAEDGRFVFKNKLLLEPHSPALVNVEWWAVGSLSRLLGRRPFLAYRLVALAVLGAFLLAVDRMLRRCGLPATHRLSALLLVATGGGLGGLLFELTPRPVHRCADLSVGLFPFFEALANPHWLAGTWLLLETLLSLDKGSTRRRVLRTAGFGTVLGLVRPYDLVLAALATALSVPLTAPRHEWWPRVVPLLGLAPVALYNYWVFYAIPTFGTFGTSAGATFGMPPTADFVLGLAPPGLAALAAVGTRAEDDAQRACRMRLLAWTALVVAAIVWRPVSFSQQFVIGAGLPLLLITCLGFSRWRPWVLAVLAAAFCSTAFVALRIVFRPDPNWHVPAERREAALALRPHCRPGELAFSPADIGLYTIGLTACHAFVSHSWAPGNLERDALVRAFYGAMPPDERSRLLDRLDIAYVVLPGDPGPLAREWLGDRSRFAQVARVGPPSSTVSVYARRP